MSDLQPDKNTSVFPHGHIDRSTWKRVRLGDFGKVLRGVSFDGVADLLPVDSAQGIAILRSNNIKDSVINYTDLIYVRKSKVAYSQLMQGNDILICMANGSKALVGKSALFRESKQEFSFGAFMGVFRCHRTHEASFLSYLLQGNQYREYIDVLLSGSSINNLRPSDIENLEFSIPSSSEQLSIAHALKSCDDYISTLQSLITKYEAIKKATVNLLLKPKENWRRVKLGDVCFAFSYGVGASAIPYDGINRYIRITDIDDDSHEFRPSPLSSPSHFNHDHIVNEGDILIARTGASVGKSYIYHPNDGKLVFAGFLIRAAINHDIADPYFIFLQTLTDKYRQWVAEESMRSGQPGLNIDQCKDFEFCIPKMSEQHKIAAQINEIDAVLNNCKKQLDKAQNLKQGMMSYFFG
jgi:restriction endonuclease S subunit